MKRIRPSDNGAATHDPAPTDPPPARVWLRVLLAFGGLALLLAAFGLAAWIRQHEAADKVRAVVAGLDETDPGWRIDDIEAARAEQPPGRSSADVAVAAAKLMPPDWPYWETDPVYKGKFDGLPANRLLDPERAKVLADEMAKMASALAEARGLAADLPAGKYRTQTGSHPFLILLPDHNALRQSARLLRYASWDQAQQGDTKGALLACRAGLHAGRSLGDELYPISLLLRAACVSDGLISVERALALGEAADADLTEVQALLRLEERHPTLRIVMRGQRALYHAVHEAVTEGNLSAEEAFSEPGTAPPASWWPKRFGRAGVNVPRQHLLTLELFNDLVEAAKLPTHEQIAAERAVESRVVALPPGDVFVKKLLPAITQQTTAYRRKLGEVRAMDALLAAERYRLQNGRWPGGLEDVPAELLPAVPLDPYDGKPVRYRRTADGVVVYVVGDNLTEDGGDVERAAGGHAPDWGYRLWDVNKRRQPPRQAGAANPGQ